MPHEVELKFAISTADVKRLEAAPWFRKLSDAGAREELVTVYFDTRKFALRDQGLSLRVRHANGQRVQTVKANGSGVDRGEWENEIDGDLPDLSAVKKTPLRKLGRKKLNARLRPVFETRVDRKTLPWQLDGGTIELAIDRGQVIAGDQSTALCEVELELKDGDPTVLAAGAKRLRKTIGLRYGAKSKAERGYELIDGETTHVVRAGDIDLSNASTAAEAFTAIGFSCLHHFAANEAAVRKHDAEGVHQIRVGLRRLRAAISIFKDILQDTQSEQLKVRLKWLTDQFGSARDYDVFLAETVKPLREQHPDRDEVSALEQVVAKERKQGFEKAVKTIDSDAYHDLVVDTALWLVAGNWLTSDDPMHKLERERPLKAYASEALTQRTKKIVKKIKSLETLDAQSRHKLRIAIKKLRYGTDFFDTVFGKAGAKRNFAKSLKKLQDALGKLNDITVHQRLAQDFVHKDAGDGEKGRKVAMGMGLVSGREEDKIGDLVAAAKKADAKLSSLARFWE